jgi:glycosyltransferase involved in cell wall biosynthesis
MTPEIPGVDVTLILEGTYPYVRGGVSSWVHDLIIGLPDLSFALVYLGAEKTEQQQMPRYETPPNVRATYRHFLMDPAPVAARRCAGSDPFFAANDSLHDWFHCPVGALDDDIFRAAILQEGRSGEQCAMEFFHSEAAWSQILGSYLHFCPETAFLSYFWAVRNTHGPLIKLVDIARTIPRSTIYHAVSTGYAGLLGAMLHRLHRRPLVLTEHGIYTKERQIELRALFLRDGQGCFDAAPDSGLQHHEQLWVRLFQGMGRLVYAAADPIISLYEQNRQRQIIDGADPARTRIIPNGVNVERYAPLRQRRPANIPRVLGLIGRIVPIKDIKTFIRAVHALVGMMPDAEGWLIGPEEEDPAYVTECRELVRMLQISNNIKFKGFQRVDDVLPGLGLLVLTSISEAFPLVIGESYASGLPVVTTDVGACRDLVEGAGQDDRALGLAGRVVPIFDPQAVALAAYELLSDSACWHAAQRAGIERVERFYRQSSVITRYRDIYLCARRT